VIMDTAQAILDLRFWVADWRGRSPLASSRKHQASPGAIPSRLTAVRQPGDLDEDALPALAGL